MKSRLRMDYYAIYRGELYRIFGIMRFEGFFISVKEEHIDDKCFEHRGRILRPVTPEEVEEVFNVEPYGIYKGYKVGFMGPRVDEEKKEITPWDGDEVIKALNMPQVDRGEYRMEVPIKDIDFYEREEYYDKYEFFQDIHNPYKTVDYHVVIENGELHRYKIDK